MTSTHFTQDCPHCHTKSAGFEVHYQWHARRSRHANILAVCGVCSNGITIYLQSIHSHVPNLSSNSVNFPSRDFSIISISPAFSSNIPDGIPENIAKFYSQGLKNLHERQWDAAGAMFRKTLDTSTKFLSPERKNLTLYVRINKLVEDNILTQAMGDWSHEIRLDGNDAVHDEEPETEEDAKRAQKFTEAFLTYAFSLPTLVATSRQRRKAVDVMQAE